MYMADYDDQKNIRHIGSHLECYMGGNWLLGLFISHHPSHYIDNFGVIRWTSFKQSDYCRHRTWIDRRLLEHLCW